jgi:anti-sigma B factor antagonist
MTETSSRHSGPPAFRADTLEVEGVTVLVVEGEVDMVTAPALRRAIEDAGPGPLVVDFSACEFIDSTGLHIVLDHRGRGSGLAIACAPHSAPERLFTLTLHERLPVYSSRTAALAAIRPS